MSLQFRVSERVRFYRRHPIYIYFHITIYYDNFFGMSLMDIEGNQHIMPFTSQNSKHPTEVILRTLSGNNAIDARYICTLAEDSEE